MDRLISEKQVLDVVDKVCRGSVEYRVIYDRCEELIKAIPSSEPKTGHCEDCKHFRKLPYHADTLGKCIHHWGFCPKGGWYCADFEPQEISDRNLKMWHDIFKAESEDKE